LFLKAQSDIEWLVFKISGKLNVLINVSRIVLLKTLSTPESCIAAPMLLAYPKGCNPGGVT
jgi:hypothetical protein